MGSALDALRRAAGWLDASPGELLGLLALLVGGVATALAVTVGPGLVGEARPGAGPGGAAGVLSPVPTASAEGSLTVHVAGAVRQPGVVVLPAGSRVMDAIEAAGGALSDAAVDGLNLAAPVEDGTRVLVPVGAAAGVAPPGAPPAGDDVHDPQGRLRLNRATAEDLQELPGVGPVIAQRILRWREEHGPFTDVGQLREVPGIGEKTFQSLVDLVTV